MPRTASLKLSHHKASGQAFVYLGKAIGRRYLGPWGSKESFEEFARVTASVAQNGMLAGQRSPRQIPHSPSDLAIAELAVRYLQFADVYYNRKNGAPTSEASLIRLALRPLITLFGELPAAEFGPRGLRMVRENMVVYGLVRRSINLHIGRIKRMFKWAVSEELLPSSICHGLGSLAGLRKGRSPARESNPVRPVDTETVEKTLPFLTPPVAAIVRLQLLTGARPGEICILRPADVDRSASPWVYTPTSHKTEHHGQQRRIFIGPQGQSILAPFLLRDTGTFCFSPKEGRRASLDRQKKRASSGKLCKESPKSSPRDRYTVAVLCRAITRACERAFGCPTELLEPTGKRKTAETPTAQEERRQQLSQWRAAHGWHPHQLRHTRATELRKRFGLETARTVLGHSHMNTTEVYAEQDFEQAANVMKQIG